MFFLATFLVVFSPVYIHKACISFIHSVNKKSILFLCPFAIVLDTNLFNWVKHLLDLIKGGCCILISKIILVYGGMSIRFKDGKI